MTTHSPPVKAQRLTRASPDHVKAVMATKTRHLLRKNCIFNAILSLYLRLTFVPYSNLPHSLRQQQIIMSVVPTFAQQAYENTLVLGQILKKVECKRDLLSCLLTSKAGMVSAVPVLYNSVEEGVLQSIIGQRCNMVCLDCHPDHDDDRY